MVQKVVSQIPDFWANNRAKEENSNDYCIVKSKKIHFLRNMQDIQAATSLIIIIPVTVLSEYAYRKLHVHGFWRL